MQQSHRIVATLNHWNFVFLPFSLIEILPWMNWMTFLTCPQTQLCKNCKLKAVALSTWGTLRRRRHWERHYAFLYISLPLLHDYDEKLPSFSYDVITKLHKNSSTLKKIIWNGTRVNKFETAWIRFSGEVHFRCRCCPGCLSSLKLNN